MRYVDGRVKSSEQQKATMSVLSAWPRAVAEGRHRVVRRGALVLGSEALVCTGGAGWEALACMYSTVEREHGGAVEHCSEVNRDT